MSAEAERSGRQQGEALPAPVGDEVLCPRHEPEDTGPGLLLAVLARENMQQAWKRGGPTRARRALTVLASTRPPSGCVPSGL
jgi:hypothetical protein